MAVHEDSSVYEKKSNDTGDDIVTFNAENLQNNMKIIYYSRTFLSIIGGVIAGILGLTGLMGFIFYFLVMAFTSFGLMAKAKFSVHAYFDCWNRIIIDGILGGLMDSLGVIARGTNVWVLSHGKTGVCDELAKPSQRQPLIVAVHHKVIGLADNKASFLSGSAGQN
ncbi:ER membrane complex subunit 6 [Asimina triloba]